MPIFSESAERSTAANSASISTVYALTALAMLLTAFAAYLGLIYAPIVLQGGFLIPLVILEFAILLSSRWWMDRSPLNVTLFAVFALCSGFTASPLLLNVLQGYVQGPAILLNALIATTLLSAAAGVIAYRTNINAMGLGSILFLSLIGLIVIGLLQMFIPALRTGLFEVLISGASVIVFSGFLIYDLQRLQRTAHLESPFMLALSLYLDLFNMFLSIVRFMTATSDRK